MVVIITCQGKNKIYAGALNFENAAGGGATCASCDEGQCLICDQGPCSSCDEDECSTCDEGV